MLVTQHWCVCISVVAVLFTSVHLHCAVAYDDGNEIVADKLVPVVN